MPHTMLAAPGVGVLPVVRSGSKLRKPVAHWDGASPQRQMPAGKFVPSGPNTVALSKMASVVAMPLSAKPTASTMVDSTGICVAGSVVTMFVPISAVMAAWLVVLTR